MYKFIESPNKSSRKGNSVTGVIAHFTAGGSLNSTVRYMCNKIKAPDSLTKGVVVRDGIKYYNAKASAQYITGRGGETINLVPEGMAAWHAGSRTTVPKLNGKKHLNLWTIGHEICNWGGLLQRNGKFYCWPSNWTKEYKGPTPVKKPRKYEVTLLDKSYRAGGRINGLTLFNKGTVEYWEPYTEEQIKAVIELWKEIVDRHKIEREWISGHETVDPTRKMDPGPAFPWDQILDEVYGSKPEENISVVEPLNEDHIYELSLHKQEPRKEASICSVIFNNMFKE